MKTLMRSLAVAATVAAASVGATAANAALTVDYNGETGFYSSQNIAKGAFDQSVDILFGEGVGSFTLNSTSINKRTSIADLKAFFNGNAFTLTRTGNAASGFQYTGFYGTPTAPIDISAGTHTLRFTGTSGGAGGYSGQIAFAAVPEPASWALMIGGVGIVGGAMRRRQRTTVSFA